MLIYNLTLELCYLISNAELSQLGIPCTCILKSIGEVINLCSDACCKKKTLAQELRVIGRIYPFR